MGKTRNKILSLVPAALIIALTGCHLPRGAVEVILQQPTPSEQNHNPAMAKRFAASTLKGTTAAESAIELSAKYARLSDETAALKEKNQKLDSENNRLKGQVAALETDLQQAQLELSQANDLLIEMRIELNNWKSDVLGFRSEMRDAEQTQLEALLKILKILGGEVKQASVQAENTKSDAAKTKELGRLTEQQMPALETEL